MKAANITWKIKPLELAKKKKKKLINTRKIFKKKIVENLMGKYKSSLKIHL